MKEDPQVGAPNRSVDPGTTSSKQQLADEARLIILGAGKPHSGEQPSALVYTSSSKRVVDWLVDAFARVMPTEVQFVSGYRSNEVVESYPCTSSKQVGQNGSL